MGNRVYLGLKQVQMTTAGRWNETRDALASVAASSHRFDDDGLDLFFINNEIFRKNIRVSGIPCSDPRV